MQIDGKRLLVTGGAGFIGSHLVRDLRSRGGRVRVVDDLSAGRRALLPEEVPVDAVDVRSAECRRRIEEHDPDAVVHLAALHYIPDCNENPEKAFNINVMGTRNVLDAAESVGVDAFVFGSTAAVYPPDRPVHAESDGVGPDDIYGRTKLVGEDLAERFHHRTGTPTVAARLFNVYGPDDTNEHLIPAILTQIEDGTREVDLGNLTPKRDFVHVTDVASALRTLLAEAPAGFRAYNVGTGEAYSVSEVVEAVGEALGEPLTVSQDEDRVRESDRPHLEADIDRITAETGWEPETEFVPGLRDLLERSGIGPGTASPG